MTAPAEVVRLDGLRVHLGKRDILVVEEFVATAGEAVALLGPNGSGKSTLLRTAALLIEPAAGSVHLFGARPRGRGERARLRRRTASVFTDPTLLDMSARGNVEVALGIHGVSGSERRRRAERWLERLGVAHLAGARPHTLSAGEAQRIALARAFAVDPELLFLDEPFASLDFETRARLVGDLRELLAASEVTALIATHDRGEAELLADRLAVLVGGRLVQDGPTRQVLEYPRSAEVASLLGHALLTPEQVRCLAPRVEARGVLAHLPPGAVRLADDVEPGASRVPLLSIRGAGGRVQLVCDLGGPATFEVGAAHIAGRELRPGAMLALAVDIERLHWLPDTTR
ncbi:MAG TPA: ATP-binding cassette domain-containing protein [Dehalococcoidia bacterium]|nr:ATP-binding cassette domain-containing protein [Dehalococcoidia bacterium]